MPTSTGIELEQAIANMKAVENDREHFYKIEEGIGEFVNEAIKWEPPIITPEVYDMEHDRDEYEENEMWRDNK